MIYKILIEGHLDERWLRWFEGLEITQRPGGETLIRGEMDQAALHGTLNRIRDLNLVLISVEQRLASDPDDDNHPYQDGLKGNPQ